MTQTELAEVKKRISDKIAIWARYLTDTYTETAQKNFSKALAAADPKTALAVSLYEFFEVRVHDPKAAFAATMEYLCPKNTPTEEQTRLVEEMRKYADLFAKEWIAVADRIRNMPPPSADELVQ